MIALFDLIAERFESIISDLYEVLDEILDELFNEQQQEKSYKQKLTNQEKALLHAAINSSLSRRLDVLSRLEQQEDVYTIRQYEQDYLTLKHLIDKLELDV